MNEILKAIAERNSCRDYADTPLTEEQIKILANAALASPSALNRQPWQVIIVTDRALLDELEAEGMRIIAADADQSAYERTMARGGKFYYNTPCMIIVAEDGSSHYTPIDCGILCENVALAAHSIGLGSVICGGVATPLRGPNGAALKKRLRFPEGYDCSIGVLVGTARSGKEPHEGDPGKITYIK